MKKIVAKYINNKLDRRYEVYDGDNLIERGEYEKGKKKENGKFLEDKDIKNI